MPLAARCSHLGLGDERDDAHRRTTAMAHESVHPIGAANELRPAPAKRSQIQVDWLPLWNGHGGEPGGVAGAGGHCLAPRFE